MEIEVSIHTGFQNETKPKLQLNAKKKNGSFHLAC